MSLQSWINGICKERQWEEESHCKISRTIYCRNKNVKSPSYGDLVALPLAEVCRIAKERTNKIKE